MIRKGKDHVWFPALQVIISVDSNFCIQVRQDPEDGKWYFRKGRKNKWEDILGYREAGQEFVKMIEPHFIRFINHVMLGDDDAKSEGSSVSGSHSEQAT